MCGRKPDNVSESASKLPRLAKCNIKLTNRRRSVLSKELSRIQATINIKHGRILWDYTGSLESDKDISLSFPPRVNNAERRTTRENSLKRWHFFFFFFFFSSFSISTIRTSLRRHFLPSYLFSRRGITSDVNRRDIKETDDRCLIFFSPGYRHIYIYI